MNAIAHPFERGLAYDICVRKGCGEREHRHGEVVSPRRIEPGTTTICGKCKHTMHWRQCLACECRNDIATVEPHPALGEHVEADHAAPRAVARRTDPSTSWEAARSVTPKVRESQAEVLSLFKAWGPMTDEGMVARYKANYRLRKPQKDSGLRTRRSELVRAGLLRDTGERRKGSTGRKMIVWEAV